MKAKAKVTQIWSANTIWCFCWRVDAIHCTDSKVALRRDITRLAEQNECLIEEGHLVWIFLINGSSMSHGMTICSSRG